MSYQQMESIVGKKIAGVRINQDKTVIVFELGDDERLAYYADGDCCSHSWIEHIDGLSALIGGTVTALEESNGETVDHPVHDCLQTYFYKLTTDKGHATIDMRNSSNGYYGGMLVETKATEESATITEDF